MLLVATIINTTGEYVIGKMATDRAKIYAAEQARSAAGATPDARAAATHDAENEYIGRFYSSYYRLVNLLSTLLQAVVVAWLLPRSAFAGRSSSCRSSCSPGGSGCSCSRAS